MMANAPIIFKVELQGLTAQPTKEAELVAVALTMKEEVVFLPNMMLELDFDKSFGRVPPHINNTSALYIAGNRTYIPRAIALRYYYSVWLFSPPVGISSFTPPPGSRVRRLGWSQYMHECVTLTLTLTLTQSVLSRCCYGRWGTAESPTHSPATRLHVL